MADRPSTPLVTILRDAAQKKGWNTAALAQEAGIERSRLKRLLSGQEPMLVDELIQLSNTMRLDPSDLGVVLPAGAEIQVMEPPESESESDSEPEQRPPTPLSVMGPRDVLPRSAPSFPDLDGVQAEQILRLGFLLGCDILFGAETDQLVSSGVPQHVLARYKPTLPIRLEAAYHRHNDPQYFPEGVQLRLSFDALYTCLFPWAAIRQITLFPFAPEAAAPAPPEPSGSGGRKVGHLRVLE